MAEAPPGTERCPHCGRPFKRLRAHLPHCKAAPAPPPGLGPGHEAEGAGRSVGHGQAAAVRGEGAAPGRGKGKGGKGEKERAAARAQVEAAVLAVAESLDLRPEEAAGIPEKLQNGVKIVIEKHRAKVVREKGGSGARGGCAGAPRRAVPAEGPGAAGSTGPGSKRGEGSLVKAVKARVLRDPPEAGCGRSPPDLAQRGGTDSTELGQQQVSAGAAGQHRALLSALRTESLHLSATEGSRGHGDGTSKSYLTGVQELSEKQEQMAVISEPILDAGRDAQLAPDQLLLHTSKRQPICLSQASGRSTQAGATGLEWFADLSPNYDGLSTFPGKPFQEDVGITVKTPKGSFSEGQQGPLSARCLMDVRLGELPMWLATCDFSPQGLLGGVQKAWSSYYNKYINVKRGGAAGISMLLAGYCVLSYSWNYQHIKRYRWRKYH